MNIPQDMSQYSQAHYFDQKHNRFPQSVILNPPPYQLLELQTLKTTLNLPPGSHLLDFGAGSGRLTIYFLRQGFNVTAMDISQQSLAELKDLYRQHHTKNWGTLTTLTTLPTSPTYDGLIGSDVLHHVDPYIELPRLKKSLKPGAHIAFTEPNAWHLPWYLYLALARTPWSIEKRLIHNHVLYLRRAFTRAGFHDIHIHGHGLLPTPLTTHTLNLTLGKLLSPVAFRLILNAVN